MNIQGKNIFLNHLKLFFFIVIALPSCTIVKEFQPGKPFVFSNDIELKGGDFDKDEKTNVKLRLYNQLDDSMRYVSKTSFFLWKIIEYAPAYDSGYAAISANNMEASLIHLGYYRPNVTFTADTSVRKKRVIPSFRFKKKKAFSFKKMQFFFYTSSEKRVTINYTAKTNAPTLIDTVSYKLKQQELQDLAMQTLSESLLKKGEPIAKANVLGEISRLVELFRNNGYYKFTSDDLLVRGDTTLDILTNVSDDPFENLKILAEANEKRNKPTIKLAVVLNNTDTTHIKKYYIDNVIIYPDYIFENATGVGLLPSEVNTKNGFTIRNNERLFRTNVVVRNMYLRKGNVYSQENYVRTINSFSRTGLWQNINIQIEESKTAPDKLDVTVQLIPVKKYAFETGLEASYSASNNINSAAAISAGNLLGLSSNVSLQNRNVAKKGIKMTNALRGGVELNLNSTAKSEIINSTEISYTNTLAFPRLIFPVNKWPLKKWIDPRKLVTQQSFIATNVSFINRINFFNLQSLSIGVGHELSKRTNRSWVVKLPNIEYSYLYNQSDSFAQTLKDNPYLQYSFNTALVFGFLNVGYNSTWLNQKRSNRQHFFRGSFEESGLVLGLTGIPINNLRKFVKTDIEYRYQIVNRKSATVYKIFAGVGVPVGKNETSLPFFKQYFSGGANSMRGWPIRGIGRGAQKQVDYDSITFNDRTGDVKLEANLEYQYNIAQIIPNSLILKGALFVDAGNVWNFRNTRPGGGYDSLQFNFNKLYQQLGVSAGMGFRLDFNYFLIRFDLGFRFKKPDVLKNDGWQIPDINLNNLFGRDEKFRRWRYENFNFSIGIGLPFQ